MCRSVWLNLKILKMWPFLHWADGWFKWALFYATIPTNDLLFIFPLHRWSPAVFAVLLSIFPRWHGCLGRCSSRSFSISSSLVASCLYWDPVFISRCARVIECPLCPRASSLLSLLFVVPVNLLLPPSDLFISLLVFSPSITSVIISLPSLLHRFIFSSAPPLFILHSFPSSVISHIPRVPLSHSVSASALWVDLFRQLHILTMFSFILFSCCCLPSIFSPFSPISPSCSSFARTSFSHVADCSYRSPLTFGFLPFHLMFMLVLCFFFLGPPAFIFYISSFWPFPHSSILLILPPSIALHGNHFLICHFLVPCLPSPLPDSVISKSDSPFSPSSFYTPGPSFSVFTIYLSFLLLTLPYLSFSLMLGCRFLLPCLPPLFLFF